MKISLPAFLILCVLFVSCNQHPASGEVEKNATTDSGMRITQNEPDDSIVLSEPIISSAKHYFSNLLSQDSFVAELPKGNIYKSNLYLKIYTAGNELLFLDSISPTAFVSGDIFGQGTVLPEIVSRDLHHGIAALFEEANFSVTGDEEAIKNATATQISDMAGWKEAVSDSSKIVFSFYNADMGISYVTYSKELKRGVVILKLPSEESED